uniref:FF domain-containing protein n=1 Tax=Amphora coffeiformis TaxID=265554 RepID=A0A7S3LCE3_9STRA
MKREAEENFISLLKEYQKEGRISVKSTWHSFHASLTELERTDARLVLSEQMDEADQQHLFADYMSDIRQAEEDEKRRSHEERRKAERIQRENYRKLLVRFAEESKLTPSSLWRDSQSLLNQDPCSAPLSQQDPQAPREMFQRFVDDWNSAYLGDRRTLSQLAAYLPKKSAFVNDETTYEDFIEALLGVSSNDDELNMEIRRIVDERSPVSSAKLYFDELKNRAKLAATARRGSSRRPDEESSEDEGEIDE